MTKTFLPCTSDILPLIKDAAMYAGGPTSKIKPVSPIAKSKDSRIGWIVGPRTVIAIPNPNQAQVMAANVNLYSLVIDKYGLGNYTLVLV